MNKDESIRDVNPVIYHTIIMAHWKYLVVESAYYSQKFLILEHMFYLINSQTGLILP